MTMTMRDRSRRDFLRTSGSSISSSWLALNMPLVLAGCTTAQTRLVEQAEYENITAHEARELGAIVDQIIPPDESPGASEAGVVYFIDVAVGGFMAEMGPMLREGLGDLQQKVTSTQRRDKRFSDLSFKQQTAILKEIEDTPFFGNLHFLTMLGMFCLPEYGGNRNNIGWDLVGFDHRHAWQAPFGYYDAMLARQPADEGETRGQS